MNFGRRASQQQLLFSLATHRIMLFIIFNDLAMASFESLDNKLTLQQGNRMTSGLHVSLLLIFSLTTKGL
jgi:hypothetical protein